METTQVFTYSLRSIIYLKILLCQLLCCHSLTLPRLSICTVECDGIVHYFVKCLNQSTIGIVKNASHTQLIIESQLLINSNTQKATIIIIHYTLILELSPLISLVNIRLSSLALMYIKNICVCSMKVCNKL